MSHHKVEVQQVSFTYGDGTKAITDMDFYIGHGESVAIIGANGAGKSTLLKLLTGIFLPDQGSIYIGDTKVTKKTLPTIRQSIGFTFQDPDHQLFMSTVYDDIAFGPRNYGYDELEVKKCVMHALETVNLSHLVNKPSHRLSGGEKRGIAIATVLAMEPSILLMDEPSVALDPGSRRRLIQLLKTFTHTKIIATHDLDMVLELCQRVLVIHEGRLVHDGPSKIILRDELFLQAHSLELPLSLHPFTDL